MFNSKKFPLIFQSEIAECALACLAMILAYYGCPLSLSEIRRKVSASLKGITLTELKQLGEQFGLQVRILRIELNQIDTLQLPCIIHWNMNHFMVLVKITKQFIFVHDPAQGVRRLRLAQMSAGFTGIAVELQPDDRFKPQPRSVTQSALLMLTLFKKFRGGIVKLIFLSCFIQLFSILGIKFIGKSIDIAFHQSRLEIVLILLIAFFASKLAEACATALRAVMISLTGSLFNREFGCAIMQHLLALPTVFFENRQLGDVVSRFTAIEKIRTVLTEGLVEGLVDGLVSVITFIALCAINLTISLIVALFAIIYFLTRLYHNNQARQYHEQALHARAHELSYFMESMRAMPAIKLFCKHEQRLQGWLKKFVNTLNSMNKLSWHKIVFDSFKNALTNLDLVITLYLGCALLAHQQLTLGLFYAFLTYRQQFMMALMGLTDKIQDFRLLKLYLDRLDDIVAEPMEHTGVSASFPALLATPPTLRLENVHFAYPQEQPLFTYLNEVIHPGELVAITGPSGRGKTTLLKIMMGLLPPTSGHLFFNHHAIYPHNMLAYRKMIAGVLQSDGLLSGTIKENISFFDPQCDCSRIHLCANLAGISEEINAFPMGFDTLIGDMGSVLSGGQKQRILLARALYADPHLLFLDEATSHLDVKKEREVNLALRALKITIIMIAHRKETIAMADRVITLVP